MNWHTTLSVLLQSTPPAVDTSGANLYNTVKTFAGNIFLAILGILGAIALFRRRVVEVLELAVLAIVAGIFIYQPQLFGALATAISGLFLK